MAIDHRRIISPAAIAHFRSIPWATQYLESPHYRLVPTDPRHLKSTGEDAFFARTINTPTTIPHCLSLHRVDLPLPQQSLSPTSLAATSLSSSSSSESPSLLFPSSSVTSPAPAIFDCMWLLHLADPDINGHPKTAHGGVLASILDELTGCCAIQLQSDKSIPIYTAKLEVLYKAPVLVPINVLCTSWVARKEGRKYWVRAQILNERGAVLTEGESLLIESRTRPKL